MRDATVSLRPADGSGRQYVESLLAANDLPTADVTEKPDCFYVAEADTDGLVGAGGLELFGPDALLRSVVVEQSARGAGHGSAITAALEREAREAGVERLYLLTTTAADFFGDRGYIAVDRSAVPERVRETREFADLCPETATVMRKSL